MSLPPAASVRSLLPAALLAFAAGTSAQSWQTWATNPGDPAWVQLDYPVVFVANEGHSDPPTTTPPHFGLDVISAGNPAAHGIGGGMYLLHTDGQVSKLFPLPEHESVPGLIDTPWGQLENGAVVEPNVSNDGRSVYFAYFHDQLWRLYGGGYQFLNLSYKGADLYRMDLGPLIDDPGYDPGNLTVQRLTFKEYTGFHKDDVVQTQAQKLEHALNPTLQGTQAYWGTIDMHLIEMRTRLGERAVWVSSRSGAANSNTWISKPNVNFNLYIADILPDGSLGPANQFQYYTTTSALSPAPLRNGMTFSYQSSTTDGRNWDIQIIDSEGRWKPLLGYGNGAELFHLGSLVVDGNGEDHFLGTRYYNQNDGGFGQIHVTRLADAGTNAFTPLWIGTMPRQLATLLTVGAISIDQPSPRINVGGQLRYIGKFSCPRAGRMGGEYLMSYTPTSANTWIPDAEGNRGVFESYIAYRPDLAPFQPHEAINVAQGKGLYAVVQDATLQYDLLWPTPILGWMERTGEEEQHVAESIHHPKAKVPAGIPMAHVGTSAIYNTDVRPYDCYNTNGGAPAPFHPEDVGRNFRNELMESFEGLRYVQDPNDFCKYLQPDAVLGIRINITSTRPDLLAHATLQYETDGFQEVGDRREAAEVLGVYSTIDENVADHSFLATIPSDTAFDFHLLDKRYGMKLVDVRSWHSLKPREIRNDCGGCHQHEAGFAIPFEGTEASSKRPVDFTVVTKHVTYDASCNPVLVETASPTVGTPEWKQDVWPTFDAQCGTCHDQSVSADAAALLAFDYADEASARQTMMDRFYASSTLGALGSPAFWAAYGERTDGRDNTLPQYQPNTAAGDWGYYFSSVHATSPGLCASQDPQLAEWVRTFGTWIDNHMPRDADGASYGYKFDRYPPTLDFALATTRHRRAPRTTASELRLGFWDNGNQVDVSVQLNGQEVWAAQGQPNGTLLQPLPPLAPADRIRVVVTDTAGNRQVKEKTYATLVVEQRGPRAAFPAETFGATPVEQAARRTGTTHTKSRATASRPQPDR